MKRGPQQKEKIELSARGMLNAVMKVFKQAAPSNSKRKNKISIEDALMSGLAMFSLKSPSLLAFDKSIDDPVLSHNLKSLYGVNHAPSDTYMREMLDEVDPRSLRECYLSIFSMAMKGKLLDRYNYLGGKLVLIDGSEVFRSDNVNCSNCCITRHHNGSLSYHHQVLAAVIAHPGLKQVIPLCPEPIMKTDGASKNDCERRGMQRFLADLKKEHPRLAVTIVSDALSANAPQINEIVEYGYHYIINAKPSGNKSLFEFLSGLTLKTQEISTPNGNRYLLRFINGVPLNNSKNAPQVNFLECHATEIKGRKTQERTFSWVTNHLITSKNAFLIAQGGRTRWKIENETFNTLKNQGYQFEHNFGHGNKNLNVVFMMLMVLAFLIDQIQEATCGLFQKALEKVEKRKYLWEKLRSYFAICLVDSWKDLFTAVSVGFQVKVSFDNSS